MINGKIIANKILVEIEEKKVTDSGILLPKESQIKDKQEDDIPPKAVVVMVGEPYNFPSNIKVGDSVFFNGRTVAAFRLKKDGPLYALINIGDVLFIMEPVKVDLSKLN